MIRPTPQNPVPRPIAVVCAGRGDVEIAYRLGHRRGPNPAGVYPAAAVVEVADASNTRADVIPTRVVDILQIHVGDGAAAAAGVANRGHIGGRAGNGDVVVRVGRSQFDWFGRAAFAKTPSLTGRWWR